MFKPAFQCRKSASAVPHCMVWRDGVGQIGMRLAQESWVRNL